MTFRGYDTKSQAQGWFKHKHKRKHKHKDALTSSLDKKKTNPLISWASWKELEEQECLSLIQNNVQSYYVLKV